MALSSASTNAREYSYQAVADSQSVSETSAGTNVQLSADEFQQLEENDYYDTCPETIGAHRFCGSTKLAELSAFIHHHLQRSSRELWQYCSDSHRAWKRQSHDSNAYVIVIVIVVLLTTWLLAFLLTFFTLQNASARDSNPLGMAAAPLPGETTTLLDSSSLTESQSDRPESPGNVLAHRRAALLDTLSESKNELKQPETVSIFLLPQATADNSATTTCELSSISPDSLCSSLDDSGRFVLCDFDGGRPFSSFLPGLAGVSGIPLWSFYVNRGQAMASFGLRNRDGAIMEFRTAELAYQETTQKGFRTIMKIRSSDETAQPLIYQPFFHPDTHTAQTRAKQGSTSPNQSKSVRRRMYVGLNEVEIEERDCKRRIQTNVLYFTVPGEGFPALARQLTVKNLGNSAIDVEVVDGLAQIIPTGVTDSMLKTMGRTTQAFMQVFHLQEDNTTPFYHLRTLVSDTEQIIVPTDGNFAISFSPPTDGENTQTVKRWPIIANPEIIFGYDTTMSMPSQEFVGESFAELLLRQRNQSTASLTASALAAAAFTLTPGESFSIYSMYGYAHNLAQYMNEILPSVMSTAQYLSGKRAESRTLTQLLTDPAEFHSSYPIFDASARQLFLDNGLRGGFPLILGSELGSVSSDNIGYRAGTNKLEYVFSRLHGDIERDYNNFQLEPIYYSHGPGNYRDVNQNRRTDVLFQPAVGNYNVRQFLSLIQADGYNPLTVSSSTLRITDGAVIWKIASAAFPPHAAAAINRLCDLLGNPELVVGDLLAALDREGISKQLLLSPQQLLASIAVAAEQNVNAAYGSGYWTDHWTYNLDQVNSYLNVFPDKEFQLLYDEWIPFFYSPATVQAHSRKYVLVNGQPKQMNAVYWDNEKYQKIVAFGAVPERNWQHSRASDSVVSIPIIGKLTVLAIVKFSALDPLQMGLEMEGGKPGWLDALNGLPGLFGSSMPETYELLRLCRFLTATLLKKDYVDQLVSFPVETDVLLKDLLAAGDHHRIQVSVENGGFVFLSDSDSFQYWQETATAREKYRESVRMNFDGFLAKWKSRDLGGVLAGYFLPRLEAAVQRAQLYNSERVAPTYFAWQPVKYEVQKETDWSGHPFITVNQFQPQPLVLFLEGPVRQLKISESIDTRQSIYNAVKHSHIYDSALKMYKICAPTASMSLDVGRIQAFASGWLENESVWTHMSYKWYLELIRGGLYEQFYEEIRSGLIPFMNADVYGRSTLEASSFIASSAYSDKQLWGTGFVARLSGATAEFLSMLMLMQAGIQPFRVDESGELSLHFQPILPADFFPVQSSRVSFRFLGSAMVTYFNPERTDTWRNVSATNINLVFRNGQQKAFQKFIPAPFAQMVRDQQVTAIDVTLSRN